MTKQIERNIGAFTIGSIKAFTGHEGETCLQGTILRDGKKVGTWSEDSWGGPHQFTFIDKATETAFTQAADAHPISVEFNAEMREKHGVEPLGNNADLVVSTIAQEIDLEKRQLAQLKRWCKTQIVIKQVGAPDGEYVTIKRTYRPELEAAVLAKYPGAEIINKRFI